MCAAWRACRDERHEGCRGVQPGGWTERPWCEAKCKGPIGLMLEATARLGMQVDEAWVLWKDQRRLIDLLNHPWQQ
eukprot:3533316-Alexandrium_andersonii.AAC.1